jgi:hypothetical protein
MPTIIDGTAGITFPNSTVQASAGQVLQVVQSSASAQDTTTGNSFIASSLSASITPKFANSKILIQVSSICTNTGNGQGNYTIYRGATNLAGGSQNSFIFYFSSSGYSFVPITMVYLDSPATTSATTYAVYFKTQTGSTSTVFGSTNVAGTITLTEIAG